MALQSFVNSVVFYPPDNSDTLQSVQLLQHKRHMRFARKPCGKQIAFYHIAPGGGVMTDERMSDVTRSSMVMLFHHGNAEDLGGCYHYAEWLASSFAVAVVMYDYCGYGFSGYADKRPRPEVTEKSVYSDADDMYAYLLMVGYPAHRIIVVGRSVGGGPACYLAQKHHKEIAGLILISTFTSCLRVVSSCCLPFFCCCVDLFPNYKRVEVAMECPVLIMHGTDDTVVPYHCSCELLETIDEHRSRALRGLLRRRRSSAAGQSCSESGRSVVKTSVMSAASNPSTPEPRADGAGRGSAAPTLAAPLSVFDLYQRAFDAIAVDVREEAARQVGFGSHEVQIGAFHKWLAGCGHNDLENREMQAFGQAVMWFVRFARAFSAERAAVAEGFKDAGEEVVASRE